MEKNRLWDCIGEDHNLKAETLFLETPLVLNSCFRWPSSDSSSYERLFTTVSYEDRSTVFDRIELHPRRLQSAVNHAAFPSGLVHGT